MSIFFLLVCMNLYLLVSYIIGYGIECYNSKSKKAFFKACQVFEDTWKILFLCQNGGRHKMSRNYTWGERLGRDDGVGITLPPPPPPMWGDNSGREGVCICEEGGRGVLMRESFTGSQFWALISVFLFEFLMWFLFGWLSWLVVGWLSFVLRVWGAVASAVAFMGML